MKKIISLIFLFFSVLIFSQFRTSSGGSKKNKNTNDTERFAKFPLQIKTDFISKIEKEKANGLTEQEAIDKVLQDRDFLTSYQNALKNYNSYTVDKGIILSKNFILVTTHKKVAILPFSIKIGKSEKNDTKKEIIKRQQEAMEEIQEKLYKLFAKNQFDYSVEIQDFEKTNQLLKSSGLWNNLPSQSSEAIAKALGVDAVIRGEYEEMQPQNRPSKLMSALMKGMTRGQVQGSRYIFTMDFYIGDGKTGEALWRQDKSIPIGEDLSEIFEYFTNTLNNGEFPYHQNIFE